MSNNVIRNRARSLRKNQTIAESLLWSKLRSRQLSGCKFRRQHPIDNYILDFYCSEAHLAVEIDGSQHTNTENKKMDNLTDEEIVGYKIVRRALEEPIRQIAENAGLDGAIIAEKAKHEELGIGFDAAAMKWTNMIEAGIIDPAKVTRSAIQNAASIASLLLTTECIITDLPEPEPAMGGGGAPGMGGMGGMGGMM